MNKFVVAALLFSTKEVIASTASYTESGGANLDTAFSGDSSTLKLIDEAFTGTDATTTDVSEPQSMTLYQQYDGFTQVIDARYYDSDGNCVGIQVTDSGEVESTGTPTAKDVDQADLTGCEDMAPQSEVMLTPEVDSTATLAEKEKAILEDPISSALYMNKGNLNSLVDELKNFSVRKAAQVYGQISTTTATYLKNLPEYEQARQMLAAEEAEANEAIKGIQS